MGRQEAKNYLSDSSERQTADQKKGIRAVISPIREGGTFEPQQLKHKDCFPASFKFKFCFVSNLLFLFHFKGGQKKIWLLLKFPKKSSSSISNF